MKKLFNYASMMMLCGLAMVITTSCDKEENVGNYQWMHYEGLYHSATQGEYQLDEENAKKIITDEFTNTMAAYIGSGFYKDLDAAKAVIKPVEAEAALVKAISNIQAKAQTYDFGPINIDYAPYYAILCAGQVVYKSKEYALNVSNNFRVTSANCTMSQAVEASVKADGKAEGMKTISNDDIFDKVAYDRTSFDVANAKYDSNIRIYNAITRELYTGTKFISITSETGKINVSFSVTKENYEKCLGEWYILVPTTIDILAETQDPIHRDVRINVQLTK